MNSKFEKSIGEGNKKMVLISDAHMYESQDPLKGELEGKKN